MKIFIVSSYPSEGCGVSKYTKGLIDGLRDNQIEVFSHRVFFDREKVKNFFWLKLFYKVLKDGPDIIHIQYTPTSCGPFLLPFLFLVSVFGFKRKVILTAHEKPGGYLRHFHWIGKRFFLWYENLVYLFSNKILVHTLEHKEELLHRYHLRTEAIELIPHGVDKGQDVTNSQIREIKNRYNLGNKKVITFLGFIRPNKGIEYLISSFSKVIKLEDDLILLIAGSAPKVWIEYFNEIKDLVKRLEIEDYVRFTGFVAEEDLPAVISISKIMVMPYTEITQSGVLYREAIAYTKPVIVTDVGGIGETVRQYNIGTVVPPNDVDSLSEAILNLIRDELKLKLYQNNEMKIKDELPWDNIAKLHLKIYQGMIGDLP